MFNNIKNLIKKEVKDNLLDKTFPAVIIDAEDPDKAGRVKIKIPGIHPADLPDDQLPWVQVSALLGANAGQGAKKVLQKGMMVNVKSLTETASEFIVESGSHIIREELNQIPAMLDADGMPFANVLNEALEKEFVPKIVSTNMKKLMTTVYGTIKENLLNIGEGNGDPDIVVDGLWLKAKDVDFRFTKPIYSIFGRNLGKFNNKFYYFNLGFAPPNPIHEPGAPPIAPFIPEDPDFFVPATPDNVELLLTDDGGVVGWNFDGSQGHAVLDKWELIIPPNVSFGLNPAGYKDYTLKYKVTDKKWPWVFDEADIHIRVVGPLWKPDFVKSMKNIYGEEKERTVNFVSKRQVELQFDMPEDIEGTLWEFFKNPWEGLEGLVYCGSELREFIFSACTPEYSFQEFEPESHLGKTEDKEALVMPNGLTVEVDGSKDNAYYSVKHPSGSRFELFDDGRGILKTMLSFQLVSMKNLLINARNMLELSVSRRINVKTEQFFLDTTETTITCENFKIKGDLHIQGNLFIEGKIFYNGVPLEEL
jgi:hypothetical protein